MMYVCMSRKFSPFRPERKKMKGRTEGSVQFLNGISKEISVPFHFQSKFQDFSAKWKAS